LRRARGRKLEVKPKLKQVQEFQHPKATWCHVKQMHNCKSTTKKGKGFKRTRKISVDDLEVLSSTITQKCWAPRLFPESPKAGQEAHLWASISSSRWKLWKWEASRRGSRIGRCYTAMLEGEGDGTFSSSKDNFSQPETSATTEKAQAEMVEVSVQAQKKFQLSTETTELHTNDMTWMHNCKTTHPSP
jgi:hypothetical protein